MDKFYEILKNRTSSRDFKPGQKIDSKLLDKWNNLISIQPTSTNGQQFSFIMIENQETKNKIMELCWGQKQIGDSSVFYLFIADQRKYIRSCEIEGVDPENYLAQTNALLTSAGDAFISAQTLMIAAELEGYGSCYIGAVRGAINELRELLGLPEYALPLVGMAIGKPQSKAGLKPKNIAGTIHIEKYDLDKVNKSVDDYDKVMVDYFVKRGAKDRSTWTSRLVQTYEKMAPLAKNKVDKEIKDSWPSLK